MLEVLSHPYSKVYLYSFRVRLNLPKQLVVQSPQSGYGTCEKKSIKLAFNNRNILDIKII